MSWQEKEPGATTARILVYSIKMSEQYTRYKGMLFPSFYCTMESLTYAENEFQVRDDDIFIVTYPKSGTNWMIEILSLILKNGDPTWCKTVPIWDRAPWYEVCITKELLQNNSSQRLITSHLPAHLSAKSLYKSKAKVVYVARDPRDTLVSLHYFYHISKFLKDPDNFQETLGNFLKGEVVYGLWFEHIKGWLSVQDKIDMLFITYEELQQDIRGSVIKICKFLGKQLDNEEIDSVVKHSSFKSMKENKMSNYSLLDSMATSKFDFLRKGVSGDWKNHFTVAQSELFDAVYKENMKDINMKFIWD